MTTLTFQELLFIRLQHTRYDTTDENGDDLSYCRICYHDATIPPDHWEWCYWPCFLLRAIDEIEALRSTESDSNDH